MVSTGSKFCFGLSLTPSDFMGSSMKLIGNNREVSFLSISQSGLQLTQMSNMANLDYIFEISQSQSDVANTTCPVLSNNENGNMS